MQTPHPLALESKFQIKAAMGLVSLESTARGSLLSFPIETPARLGVSILRTSSCLEHIFKDRVAKYRQF